MEVNMEVKENNKVKEYNQKYYSEHKNDKFHCDVCNKDYSIFNRDQHYKTAKHNKIMKNTIIIHETPIQKIIKFALLLGTKIEMKDNKLIIE